MSTSRKWFGKVYSGKNDSFIVCSPTKDLRIRSQASTSTWLVDEPLEPPCWFCFHFLAVSWSVISETTDSRILLQRGDIDIGLISFIVVGVWVLGIGATISVFHTWGHFVLSKLLLYIAVKGIASSSDNLFTKIFCMSPGTVHFRLYLEGNYRSFRANKQV